MPGINGNMKYLLAGFGVLTTLGSAAVGYGTLRSSVGFTERRLDVIEQKVETRSASAEATPAGVALLAKIALVQQQLEQVQKQLDRMEGLIRQNNANNQSRSQNSHSGYSR